MLEGKLPRPGDPRPLDIESADGDRLRPLSWTDLVARLTAARELRGEGGASSEASEGSFDASSARLIAAHHNGKQLVNLDDSSNGKGSEATASPVRPAGLGALPGAVRE
jgi:hypothetical protein